MFDNSLSINNIQTVKINDQVNVILIIDFFKFQPGCVIMDLYNLFFVLFFQILLRLIFTFHFLVLLVQILKHVQSNLLVFFKNLLVFLS